MTWPRLFHLLCLLCVASLFSAARAAELPPAFAAALDAAGIPRERVAVVVHPLDAAPVLSYHADAAFNPASVMKLVTSFAALQQLGPDYRWMTEVWAQGPIVDGVLQGDLVIKGRGDPALTLERLWLLQHELRMRGVRQVQGRLVLDTTFFSLPDYDPARLDGEPLAAYNALPGALMANFGTVAARLQPEGDAVRVTLDPALPGLATISQLALEDAAECGDWKDAVTPTLDAAVGTLRLIGRYARGCGERTLALALFDPATTFDRVFRALWAEGGGRIDGPTVAGEAPSAPPLLRFPSEPLAAALVRLNKYSNNVMTRNLFLTLGAERYGGVATPEKGARAVRDALAATGVDTRKLVLENGAGLSRVERITAGALDQLLHAAAQGTFFAEFEAALPIAAVDGTLQRRFNDSAVGRHAHLKTGSLRDVRALAGYVLTAQGKRVSFVMLVNHPNAHAAGEAQRALLEWVHAGQWEAPAVRSLNCEARR